VVRGVTRYANVQRRWLLSKMRRLGERIDWPDFDGAICAGVEADLFARVRERCPHVVFCSGGGDPQLSAVVALDDVQAGVQAAEHLLNCRLQHFAFYGSLPSYGATVKRLAGFRETLVAKGRECVECPAPRPSADEWASHAHRPQLIQWLRDLPKPVGIMAFDDTAAQELADACLEANIGVPDRVAIVGVNNDDLLCDSAWPPLSSVEGDYSRVGYAAAQILDRMLAGQVLKPAERLVRLPPLGVVQRQSTNVLAIDDVNLVDAIRFIREHACDPCTVHDVLRAVPVGRRWLERQFVARLGRTPHDEISRVRIDAARRLLLQPGLRMNDVAYKCGFAELKSFYLTFRKVARTSPAVYRRMALVGGAG
jgi:LacI family transcriptional regulator